MSIYLILYIAASGIIAGLLTWFFYSLHHTKLHRKFTKVLYVALSFVACALLWPLVLFGASFKTFFPGKE